MTWTVGPFDSVAWSEASWYDHMSAAMPSGVIGTKAATATTGELAFSSSGLSITLAAGKANVGGGGAKNAAPLTSVSVGVNSNATLARRDRIVLRRDLGTHTVGPVVIQGTPAASPVAPNLVRSSTQWDMPLFSFIVPAASGTTLSGVVDERVWLYPDPGDAVGAVTVGHSTFDITKVATGTVLLATVTVPAVSVATRITWTALGKTGFDSVDRAVAWTLDSYPGSATNVVQDEPQQVNAPAASFVSISQRLTYDLPAGTAATCRVVLNSTGPVYNKGGLAWVRVPI